MEEKPKRRWFQFRLSTWLVLIGILAWFLAIGSKLQTDSGEPAGFDYGDDGWAGFFLISRASGPPTPTDHWGIMYFFPPEVRWPVLALAGFLAWKYLWPRRRRSGQIERLSNDTQSETKTKYRWLQSRLSTWLVLIGILAWLMSTQPIFWYDKPTYSHDLDIGWHGDFLIGRLHAGPHLSDHHWRIISFFPPRSRWPVLALVTFLGWKLIWPRIRRWHSRS